MVYFGREGAVPKRWTNVSEREREKDEFVSI